MKFDHIQLLTTDLNERSKFEKSRFKLSRPSMLNFVNNFKCHMVELNFAT